MSLDGCSCTKTYTEKCSTLHTLTRVAHVPPRKMGGLPPQYLGRKHTHTHAHSSMEQRGTYISRYLSTSESKRDSSELRFAASVPTLCCLDDRPDNRGKAYRRNTVLAIALRGSYGVHVVQNRNLSAKTRSAILRTHFPWGRCQTSALRHAFVGYA